MAENAFHVGTVKLKFFNSLMRRITCLKKESPLRMFDPNYRQEGGIDLPTATMTSSYDSSTVENVATITNPIETE